MHLDTSQERSFQKFNGPPECGQEGKSQEAENVQKSVNGHQLIHPKRKQFHFRSKFKSRALESHELP